jgi:hypothetical protein
VIPLNQLIPECLLALGGAFLLGNLAAYIRLRPAWRDAKRARDGRLAKQDTGTAANGVPAASAAGQAGAVGPGATDSGRDTSGTRGRPSTTRRGSGAARAGTARTVGAESGVSNARVTKAVDPKSGGSRPAPGKRKAASGSGAKLPSGSGAKLPSRARVLANVVIGLLITVVALATLIRA